MPITYRPRGDFVICQRTLLAVSQQGFHLPESSNEAKVFKVVAKGPKVEDLEVGDEVKMTGQEGVDWSWIHGSADLLILRDANVVLVVNRPLEAGGDEAVSP